MPALNNQGFRIEVDGMKAMGLEGLLQPQLRLEARPITLEPQK